MYENNRSQTVFIQNVHNNIMFILLKKELMREVDELQELSEL